MHRGALATAVAIALLLSGCVAGGSGPSGPAGKGREPVPSDPGCATPCANPSPTATPDKATPTPHDDPVRPASVRGVVLDKAKRPIPTARVEIAETGQAQNVSASGTFEFRNLVSAPYLVVASAPNYANQTLKASPGGPALEFSLERLPSTTAYRDPTVRFRGHIQCALEVLIITPACDTILTEEPLGQEPLFNDTFSTLLPVGANWKTVVVEVVFDPAAQPGFDGLRVTARGTYDAHEFGTYAAYGQFTGKDDFAFRLEPGQSYEGGDAPVPSNTTMFELETYPQSHGWHTVCDPRPDGDCFLGAGAGLDVDFDLFMTVFYVEPAPDGWTMKDA